jgi:oxygen-independent coproporphyrinogen-3 oxidase
MPASHLYVHVPFCSRRCAYCDFSIAVRRTVPVDDYVSGLTRELDRLADRPRATVDTVYLGGGTPSRLGAEGISRVLELVRSRFDVAGDAEVTIEANPEDITRDTVTAWRASGVNRLSIGIQTFSDDVLRWMHRVHSADEGRRAIDAARSGGITNFSIDLIFALPEGVERRWDADLEQALALEPPHISLYGLTIEASTPLARWESRGLVAPSDEERYAREFLLADSLTSAAGYRHYEVSNFARPGFESRHNSAYWTGTSYIGIGPSAHSYDGKTRQWNVPAYADWLGRLTRGDSIVADAEVLDEGNRASEKVYLGLRTDRGLHARQADLEIAETWQRAGWAQIDDDVVRLTPEGWLRLDSLAAGLTGF